MAAAMPASTALDATVLIVGAGGIGAPAAIALVEAGVRNFIVADDDRVELTNLHRQILFSEIDVGRPKLEAFAEAIERRASKGAGARVERFPSRALPENVLDLVDRADVVIDATDNFASRFLLADAAHLRGVAIVHAAAVRLHATVLGSAPAGRPCYRCLFEDVPPGDAVDCATAGIVGPVCGVSGAIAADLALRLLAEGHAPSSGVARSVWTFDAAKDRLREVKVRRRPDCALCGDRPTISAIDEARYTLECAL